MTIRDESRSCVVSLAGEFGTPSAMRSYRGGNGDLVPQVRRIVEETGIDPHTLRLEITESITIGDADREVSMLSQLKALGIRLSIDDFGTGYSSLSYLHRFPVDILKIDRSFVVRLFDSPRDEALVASIIRIAHAFDVKVVAEGVEEARFVTRLSELGCDEFQGYYFAKPMPADVFIAWMGDHLR